MARPNHYTYKHLTPLQRLQTMYVPVTESGCWVWVADENGHGYGRVKINGKLFMAHRAVYELFKGPIPEGLELDHLCRVTQCVNPDHLEAITPQVNTLRSLGITSMNAKKTHCDHGHEFTLDNTHVRENGGRICRACKRDTWHRRRK